MHVIKALAVSIFGLLAISSATLEEDIVVERVDKMWVNIDIAVSSHEIEQYPEIWESFDRALAKWASLIPVNWSIHIVDSPFAHLPLGCVRVRIMDMSGLGQRKLLGLWQPYKKELLISNELEKAAAYFTSLHELGHLFGLSHVVNHDDDAVTSFLVMPENKDAREFLMYPSFVKDLTQNKISTSEIQMAGHGLVHFWTKNAFKTCEMK